MGEGGEEDGEGRRVGWGRDEGKGGGEGRRGREERRKMGRGNVKTSKREVNGHPSRTSFYQN